MTNEEAAEIIERNQIVTCHCCMHPQEVAYCEKCCKLAKAIQMAIEALKRGEEHES